jgi:hypothetical protein
MDTSPNEGKICFDYNEESPRKKERIVFPRRTIGFGAKLVLSCLGLEFIEWYPSKINTKRN